MLKPKKNSAKQSKPKRSARGKPASTCSAKQQTDSKQPASKSRPTVGGLSSCSRHALNWWKQAQTYLGVMEVDCPEQARLAAQLAKDTCLATGGGAAECEVDYTVTYNRVLAECQRGPTT